MRFLLVCFREFSNDSDTVRKSEKTSNNEESSEKSQIASPSIVEIKLKFSGFLCFFIEFWGKFSFESLKNDKVSGDDLRLGSRNMPVMKFFNIFDCFFIFLSEKEFEGFGGIGGINDPGFDMSKVDLRQKKSEYLRFTLQLSIGTMTSYSIYFFEKKLSFFIVGEPQMNFMSLYKESSVSGRRLQSNIFICEYSLSSIRFSWMGSFGLMT